MAPRHFFVCVWGGSRGEDWERPSGDLSFSASGPGRCFFSSGGRRAQAPFSAIPRTKGLDAANSGTVNNGCNAVGLRNLRIPESPDTMCHMPSKFITKTFAITRSGFLGSFLTSRLNRSASLSSLPDPSLHQISSLSCLIYPDSISYTQILSHKPCHKHPAPSHPHCLQVQNTASHLSISIPPHPYRFLSALLCMPAFPVSQEFLF